MAINWPAIALTYVKDCSDLLTLGDELTSPLAIAVVTIASGQLEAH